jgi:hypothetical protein
MHLLPFTSEEVDVKIQILDFDFNNKYNEEEEKEDDGEVKQVCVRVYVDNESDAALLIGDLN